MFKNIPKLLIISSIIIVLLSLLSLLYYQKNIRYSSQNILPNIYLDHISVGGLKKEEALALLEKRFQSSMNFKIDFVFQKKTIASVTAQQIDYQLPLKSGVDQAFSIGRGPGLAGLYQQVALHFGWESYNFDLNPLFDEKYLNNLLQELDGAYKLAPVDARFDFKDSKVNAFKMDKDGYRLEVETALANLKLKMGKQRFEAQNTIKVKIPQEKIAAKIRLKDINNLGITGLVAEGTSHFAGSSPERIHNVVTGANRLNGMIIKPGQTFTFEEFLGEISGRTGFAQAYVIKNGRTVLDDGGGICQVSTTMFRTALNAGLPILNRTAHAYRVGYYEQDAKPGLDATIYLPSVDLKFKNDYKNALLIQTSLDLEEMKLSFAFYGTPDKRVVELSDITIWNIAPAPPPEYIDDFSLPIGVTKQVDFAAPGATSKFTYKVTTEDGKDIIQEFVSNYRPWKAIFLVGKKS